MDETRLAAVDLGHRARPPAALGRRAAEDAGRVDPAPGVEEADAVARDPRVLALAGAAPVRVAEDHPVGLDPQELDHLAHGRDAAARDRAGREVRAHRAEAE